MQLMIEYLPVNKIRPYERNTRKHGDEDVDMIAKSIERYGFSDPVGIWGNENLVVEGHGRLLAAKKLGMESVPVIRLDHMTDEQRREYAIAHNRTAELSGWDFTALQQEMSELNFDDFDLGFGDDQVTEPNFDDFFGDSTPKEEKPPKQIQCPHCGLWFDAE